MLASSLTLAAITALTDDLGGGPLQSKDELLPVNTVWPMGFSWSSAVAQANTLACVEKAGVPREHILSPEHPVPADQSELCCVATDDTIFAHRDYERGVATLGRFDTALDEAGVPRSKEKDITLVENIAALGCELSSRPHLAQPALQKLLTMLEGSLDLLHGQTGSPHAVNALLGLEQWFALLQRPALSVYDNVYGFVRSEPQTQPTKLPVPVQRELAVALGLLPLLSVSLDKPWHTELLACDASPAFGFGVCAATCTHKQVAGVGRLAEKRGDYVRLHKDPGSEEKHRLGMPHTLGLDKRDFRTIVSAKAKWSAHSGVLEGHGLLMTLRWLARARKNFHSKVVVLVDAKAVLGAAAKGRTSAPGLRGVIRAIGALSLACDWLVRLVYVPSEDNPADEPSRGERARARTRQGAREKGPATRLDRHMLHLENAYQHLCDCGMIGTLGSASSTGGSMSTSISNTN